jgi:hypothetical protein
MLNSVTMYSWPIEMARLDSRSCLAYLDKWEVSTNKCRHDQ